MSIEDKLYVFLKGYKTMPDWMKRAVSLPFSMLPRTKLLGQEYTKMYNEALSFEFSSSDIIDEYQFLKLKQVLEYSYKYVPYYTSLWNSYGIDINRIQDFDDFKKLIPFTTREDVLNNYRMMTSKKYKVSDFIQVNSGGSTGNPLTLYYLKGYTRTAYNAYIHILWSRFDCKVEDRYARLRGDSIGKNKILSFDPYRNSLMLSSFSLNEKNANQYLAYLLKYKVKYIAAYPSSLFHLVQLSQNKSFHIPSLKAIMLGSENILDYQVDAFKSFFGIDKISVNYGHGEFTSMAGNCAQSQQYHFLPSYGYTEFDRQIDNPYNEIKHDVVEIVSTSFLNPAMPLIRYRSKDYGIVSHEKCSCGRNHLSLDKILGREQEIAEGFNGEKITLTALIFGRHLDYFNHTIKMQIINFAPGRLTVRVVPKQSFLEKHSNEIIISLSPAQGMPFSANVEIVESIESTKRGKNRFFVKTY